MAVKIAHAMKAEVTVLSRTLIRKKMPSVWGLIMFMPPVIQKLLKNYPVILT